MPPARPQVQAAGCRHQMSPAAEPATAEILDTLSARREGPLLTASPFLAEPALAKSAPVPQRGERLCSFTGWGGSLPRLSLENLRRTLRLRGEVAAPGAAP